MGFASKGSASMPSVSKAPAPPGAPVPIPFPNAAQQASSCNAAISKVLVHGSELASHGAGLDAHGGKTFSSKVSVQGKGVVTQTASTAHGGSLASHGAGLSPSQTRVVIGA